MSTTHLPSYTYFYKEPNLDEFQEKNFKEAWNLFSEDENSKIVTKEDCLNLKINNNALYVLSNFNGDVFEHLRSIKVRIVSVNCLLHTHKTNKKLPRSKVCPLYSLSMTDLVICCTNIEKKMRQDIYDRVEMMNGKTSRVFTQDVTHLITSEVGSAKYHAAGEFKIPIMLPEWVNDVWETSAKTDVNAVDDQFMKHKCPIFNKYVICASGYTSEVKKEIKNLIEAQGGTYNGDLVCGTTTHLVTEEPSGAKYNHAEAWKISVVNSKWIYDSMNAKYCLPEKQYQLVASKQPNANTSTPTNNRSLISNKKSKQLDIDISMIASTTMRNVINETENVTMSTTHMNNNELNSNNNTNANGLSKYNDILKELNAIGKIKSCLFDGCGIYCDNFDTNINEKLKKLFNSGGAIRFDDFHSDVTHVIVNQVNEKKCKNYVETNPEVNIVSIDWVIDSCKENETADCKNYFAFKNALNSVKTPKKRAREENQKALGINQSVNISMKSYENDLNTYLAQYLTKDTIPKETNMTPSAVNATKNNNNGDKRTVVLQEADLNQYSSSSASSTSSIVTSSMKSEAQPEDNSTLQLINAEKQAQVQKFLFNNKSFLIMGFDVDETFELKTLIESMDGNVIDVDESNASVDLHSDYILFPMTLCEPVIVTNSVTVYWLRKCIEQNKLLPLDQNPLYQPIPRFNQDRPLTGCVITISGYISYERETIANLCQLVGAVTQQPFSSKQTKTVFQNTHLICNVAEGPKYTAAKNWKIPAVTIEWLIDSCVSGIKADESKYSIDLNNKNDEFIKNLDRIRRNVGSESQTTTVRFDDRDTTELLTTLQINKEANEQTTLNASSNDKQDPTVDFNNSSPAVQNDCSNNESPKNTTSNANDSSLLSSSTSKKPRLDESQIKIEKEVPKTPLSCLEQFKTSKNPFKTPTAEANAVFKTPQAVAVDVNTRKSVLENFATPPCAGGVALNPRLKELKQSEANISQVSTPKTAANTSASANKGYLTPLFMKSPNDPRWKNFEGCLNPNIDIDKLMELMNTPNPTGGPPQTPIHELFVKSLRQACINAREPGFYDYTSDSPEVFYTFERDKHGERLNHLAANEEAAGNVNFNGINAGHGDNDDDDIPPTPLDVKHLKELLKNVKVYVSKKLAKNQTELSTIVESLGGDFMWIYNQTCTHFIYTGKISDNNKELRVAKEQNKIIVSPYWLYACQEQKEMVDEALYPCTYNPSKCAVVTSRTPKPSLSVRRNSAATADTGVPNETTATGGGGGTPVVAVDAKKSIRASQLTRSQMKKTSSHNIIKNYCSDEDDGENNENDDSLMASNHVNLRLIKKKPPSSHNLAEMTKSTNQQTQNNCENDSEMNLLDSQFMKNLDMQKPAAKPVEAVASSNYDIPDSIDIKNDFLNQLQDKLANIRNNSVTSNNNNNNNNNCNSNVNNLNTSQTNVLNEQQIINELNKSGRCSKWGNSISGELDDKQQKQQQQQRNEDDDLLCIRILEDNNSRDSNADDQQQPKQKYNFNFKTDTNKKRRQNKSNNTDNDDVFYDEKKMSHHGVAPSQIQVTLWNEEHQQHQTLRRKNENISDRLANYYKN